MRFGFYFHGVWRLWGVGSYVWGEVTGYKTLCWQASSCHIRTKLFILVFSSWFKNWLSFVRQVWREQCGETRSCSSAGGGGIGAPVFQRWKSLSQQALLRLLIYCLSQPIIPHFLPSFPPSNSPSDQQSLKYLERIQAELTFCFCEYDTSKIFDSEFTSWCLSHQHRPW